MLTSFFFLAQRFRWGAFLLRADSPHWLNRHVAAEYGMPQPFGLPALLMVPV